MTNATNVLNVIETLDNAAQIPALKAVVHSSMAKCIGAIRQSIRNRTFIERNGEDTNSLDERNEQDGQDKECAPKAMGFQIQEDPIKTAYNLHAVWSYANSALQTIAASKWDQPLSFVQMLDFMQDKAQPIDSELVKQLAKIAKCDPKHILQMHEIQERKDRELLIEMRPEIEAVFNGFDGSWSDDIAIEAVTHLQLAMKVQANLGKAKDSVLLRAMKTRRLSELGDIALMEEGEVVINKFIAELEERYDAEIRDAIESGRLVL